MTSVKATARFTGYIYLFLCVFVALPGMRQLTGGNCAYVTRIDCVCMSESIAVRQADLALLTAHPHHSTESPSKHSSQGRLRTRPFASQPGILRLWKQAQIQPAKAFLHCCNLNAGRTGLKVHLWPRQALNSTLKGQESDACGHSRSKRKRMLETMNIHARVFQMKIRCSPDTPTFITRMRVRVSSIFTRCML